MHSNHNKGMIKCFYVHNFHIIKDNKYFDIIMILADHNFKNLVNFYTNFSSFIFNFHINCCYYHNYNIEFLELLLLIIYKGLKTLLSIKRTQ